MRLAEGSGGAVTDDDAWQLCERNKQDPASGVEVGASALHESAEALQAQKIEKRLSSVVALMDRVLKAEQRAEAAEARERALRQAVERLEKQWRTMAAAAFAEGPIQFDEAGHAGRWTSVEMCADELRALLTAPRPDVVVRAHGR
jgi:hypothetical protein